MADDKINWAQVEKWVQRGSLNTMWQAYGMPDILNPHRTAFADVDPFPRWSVPEKIFIAPAITGAFFTKAGNPNQPITTDEIRASAEECIHAGAPSVHIHVRDDNGYNALDLDRFHAVVDPLRARHPDICVDGCFVAVNDEESELMREGIKSDLFDVVPVNTTAICCGDNMFFKAPHVVIEKTRLTNAAGKKPVIAVYTDGDIDNARRYLIASGLLKPPYYFLVLPALPGCSPMHDPEQMVDGLMRMVRAIRAIDDTSVIGVCCAGRASTYLGTLAILLGLHVRVGLEDTIWPWPHKDDVLRSNVDHFNMLKGIAGLLGREVMTPSEYRRMLGIKARVLQDA